MKKNGNIRLYVEYYILLDLKDFKAGIWPTFMRGLMLFSFLMALDVLGSWIGVGLTKHSLMEIISHLPKFLVISVLFIVGFWAIRLFSKWVFIKNYKAQGDAAKDLYEIWKKQ